jgi:hypothetical protein
MKLWVRGDERSSGQNPVYSAGWPKASGDSSGMAPDTTERIGKLQINENGRSWFLAPIDVEVACQDNWYIRGELISVPAEFRELSISKSVVPPNFRDARYKGPAFARLRQSG